MGKLFYILGLASIVASMGVVLFTTSQPEPRFFGYLAAFTLLLSAPFLFAIGRVLALLREISEGMMFLGSRQDRQRPL